MEFCKVSEIKQDVIRKYVMNLLKTGLWDGFSFIDSLIEIYPEFSKWFEKKVKHDLTNSPESRDIILCFSTRDKVAISGIAIVKRSEEKKICTLLVHPNYRRQGVASGLIEECFVYLGTSKPLLTVSSNVKPQLEKLLQKYNFTKTDVKEDYYSPGVAEYIYNGELS